MTNGSRDDLTPMRTASRSDFWMVFRKFVKQGTTIATPAPSGRYLVREMLKGIDFDQTNTIVELGAGTGPITAALLKRMRPHTQLIVVEIEKDFCDRLRKRFPTADIVHGDAAHLDRILAERGIQHIDQVISGLPLPSIPHATRQAILASAAKCMSRESVFRQLTIMPYYFRRFYRNYFEEVSFKLVPVNFPPAGVYLCRRFKPDAPDPKLNSAP
jgi:phospholipid N-methyltransferase